MRPRPVQKLDARPADHLNVQQHQVNAFPAQKRARIRHGGCVAYPGHPHLRPGDSGPEHIDHGFVVLKNENGHASATSCALPIFPKRKPLRIKRPYCIVMELAIARLLKFCSIFSISPVATESWRASCRSARGAFHDKNSETIQATMARIDFGAVLSLSGGRRALRLQAIRHQHDCLIISP